MTVAAPLVVGRQTPTFLWMPEYTSTLGDEVIGLAEAAGLVLDPWQQLLVNHICAEGTTAPWQVFEAGIVVSRQNGKGAVLCALELAWLFLLGDDLVLHSAHLFETSREHFLKMQALVRDNDDFRRRVRRMREGRGSEEIELLSGARLKFMTRKGGAGRGFTGSKVVLDEAMYLEAAMMAAGLPTLATKYQDGAQVIYTGSAGMKHSTQLALVRSRGYGRDDPGLMYAEWAAERPVFDPDGTLVSGDDPGLPETWAKTNPGYGIRITGEYIGKEMKAMGGPRSPSFWQERLGIGDWPAEEAAWEVIPEEAWKARADQVSQIADGSRITLALAADPERAMGTIGVCGLRADGKDHVEVIERHRGTGWMGPVLTGDGLADWEKLLVGRAQELTSKHKVSAVAVLKNSAESSLIAALVKAGVPVESPTDVEYAQACGDFYEGIVERGDVVHIGQKSMWDSVAGGKKRELPEGGWRWDPDAPADAGPVKVATLAYWARRKFPGKPRSKVW